VAAVRACSSWLGGWQRWEVGWQGGSCCSAGQERLHRQRARCRSVDLFARNVAHRGVGWLAGRTVGVDGWYVLVC